MLNWLSETELTRHIAYPSKPKTNKHGQLCPQLQYASYYNNPMTQCPTPNSTKSSKAHRPPTSRPPKSPKQSNQQHPPILHSHLTSNPTTPATASPPPHRKSTSTSSSSNPPFASNTSASARDYAYICYCLEHYQHGRYPSPTSSSSGPAKTAAESADQSTGSSKPSRN